MMTTHETSMIKRNFTSAMKYQEQRPKRKALSVQVSTLQKCKFTWRRAAEKIQPPQGFSAPTWTLLEKLFSVQLCKNQAAEVMAQEGQATSQVASRTLQHHLQGVNFSGMQNVEVCFQALESHLRWGGFSMWTSWLAMHGTEKVESML